MTLFLFLSCDLIEKNNRKQNLYIYIYIYIYIYKSIPLYSSILYRLDKIKKYCKPTLIVAEYAIFGGKWVFSSKIEFTIIMSSEKSNLS